MVLPFKDALSAITTNNAYPHFPQHTDHEEWLTGKVRKFYMS